MKTIPVETLYWLDCHIMLYKVHGSHFHTAFVCYLIHLKTIACITLICVTIAQGKAWTYLGVGTCLCMVLC